MISYERRLFAEVYEELSPMCQAHWDELGHKGGFDEFVLDIPKFLYLESRNLLVVTVAVKDSVIIGYVNCFIDSVNHNANKTVAMVDAMYVTKKYRSTMSGVGYKLLKFTEKVLREELGVGSMQFSVNVNYDISEFLIKIGYTHSETIYVKIIEEGE
jgi:hypothetical protein